MRKIDDSQTATIREELTRIYEQAGELTASAVVEAAKSTESVLHDLFCWDDTEAAHRFRELQAGAIIRRIRVKIAPDDDKPISVRAFVNVREPDDEGNISLSERGKYIGVEDAMKSTKYRAQLLDQAIREFVSIREKHSSLTELASIFAAIDETAKKRNVVSAYDHPVLTDEALSLIRGKELSEKINRKLSRK